MIIICVSDTNGPNAVQKEVCYNILLYHIFVLISWVKIINYILCSQYKNIYIAFVMTYL